MILTWQQHDSNMTNTPQENLSQGQYIYAKNTMENAVGENNVLKMLSDPSLKGTS